MFYLLSVKYKKLNVFCPDITFVVDNVTKTVYVSPDMTFVVEC